MQHDDTLTAIEFAGLSAYETWMHYCTMGGFTDYFEFTAYLHGLYALASDDADLVSEAVNELIGDVCLAEEAGICRAPYLWACAPESDVDVVRPDGGSDGAGGLDGFDDGPVRVPVDDLAEPHSAVTFGSGFLAGLDVSALSGRPGMPLPPGAPVELLGDILDSRIIGRIVSGERK